MITYHNFWLFWKNNLPGHLRPTGKSYVIYKNEVTVSASRFVVRNYAYLKGSGFVGDGTCKKKNWPGPW
jgi:hypothetical protein